MEVSKLSETPETVDETFTPEPDCHTAILKMIIIMIVMTLIIIIIIILHI